MNKLNFNSFSLYFRIVLVSVWLLAGSVVAQAPLKPRPDAFPPQDGMPDVKAVAMAQTFDEMAGWDRYPTYDLYVQMMQRWAADHPAICTLDTIGLSIQGRLILAVHIEGQRDADLQRPQFFYSSTIHGDEVTGYVMMLRLIDTLLASYGTSPRLTDLVNSVAICINPLANPDGTYRQGNHSVQGSVRYNAHNVDLNRNFPDPFGLSGSAPQSKAAIEPENEAMIRYVEAHNFRLSANLHGGSEVMNYPWDSFTSLQNPHAASLWWQQVGRRFVDSARAVDPGRFRDVNSSGVIAGGDWYVIHGGRQDYMNYYHRCLELTMEISTIKTLASDRLPAYWRALAEPFIQYIEEIHALPATSAVDEPTSSGSGLADLPHGTPVVIFDLMGRPVANGFWPLTLSSLPCGVYVVSANGYSYKYAVLKD